MMAEEELHRVNLHEPADFKSAPGADPEPFARLSDALKYAAAKTAGHRHPRAMVVTKSGDEYGWDMIDNLMSRMNIEQDRKPPAVLKPRSSRD